MQRIAVPASAPLSADDPALPAADSTADVGALASGGWAVHGARERPRVAIAGAIVIGAFGAAAGGFMEHPGWGVVAIVVLLLACRDFFLPVHIRIDQDCVERRTVLGTRRLARTSVRHLETRPGSWRVSTRGMAGRFDPRAIVVPMPAGHGERATAARVIESLSPATAA
ncbi:MAG: hypothetical protein AB8G96_14885 [Phycisphaerales bacterium]